MSLEKRPMSESAPAWVRERRQPTRAELAAKHDADGGGMAPTASNSHAFFDEDDTECSEIKVKRYNR